ncbi:MAG: hypothetical protein JNK82_07160 [Myxococcaceae bacterium]|nr:hypothetical protein [Myxococcaceae bacterium]
MNGARLAVDWVSLAILTTAYLFGRIPGVNPRLGNGAMAAACGAVAFRYWQRGTAVQLNLVMMGVAVVLALFYLARAFRGAAPKRRPVDDED